MTKRGPSIDRPINKTAIPAMQIKVFARMLRGLHCLLFAILMLSLDSRSSAQALSGGSLNVGYENTVDADAAIGYDNSNYGMDSLVVGNVNSLPTTAIYDCFLAGYGNSGTAIGAFAIGFENGISGQWSTAIGYSNSVSGWGGLAEGSYNQAVGYLSSAIGTSGYATGQSTIAVGTGITVTALSCVGVGSYNVTSGTFSGTSWVSSDPIFVVGNGSGTSSQSNAMTVLKSGAILIHPSGDLSMGSFTSGPTP
jgi:hypothetical protein